jgi:WD40 repeat protein
MSSVFMSYSRKDRDAVTSMVTALRAAGEDVWVDLDDIVPSALWMEEIKTAIANADSVIFVISPDSAASQVCGIELTYAVDLSKRVVPVVIRETPVAAVPAPLPDINWLFVKRDTFDADIARLVETLRTDIERVHLHTRLLVRATEWETRGDKSLLLRGTQLAEAEQWLAGQTDQKPTTTPAQGQFIAASRRAASRRQRSSIVGAVAVIVILAMVAAIAIVQRNQAQRRFQEAVAARVASEGSAILAGQHPGTDAQGIQEILAAQALDPKYGDALFDAVVNRFSLTKFIDTGTKVLFTALSPDGHHIATSSDGDTVQMWDADTGTPVGHPVDGSNGVAFSPNGNLLATGGSGHHPAVHLWNTHTGQLVRELPGPADSTTRVAFSPAGEFVACGTANGAAWIWNVATGKSRAIPVENGVVYGIAFSPTTPILATGGDDRTLRFWNIDTGEAVYGHGLKQDSTIESVAFSPDGDVVASAGKDGAVTLWNLTSGDPTFEEELAHPESILAVAWSPVRDGLPLATASTAGTVYLWNRFVDNSVTVIPLPGHSREVQSVAFDGDGQRLAAGSTDGSIRLWNPNLGQPIKTGNKNVYSVAFDPRGDRFASVGSDGMIQLWTSPTGSPLGSPMSGNDGPVLSIAFTPNTHQIIAGTVNGRIEQWDADNGTLVRTLPGHEGGVISVAVSSNGQLIASGGDGNDVELWDAGTGSRVRTLTGHKGAVDTVAFSRGGDVVAVGGRDKNVDLFDTATGHLIRKVPSPTSMNSVSFSPDGHRFVTGGADPLVRIWNTDTGELVHTLTGHASDVSAVAYSPDGTRIVSSSSDGSTRLWDAGTGNAMGNPITDKAVYSVAFSPDGQLIVSGAATGTVHLFPATGGVGDLCAKLSANMSRQQWRHWVSPDIDYVAVCPNLPVPADSLG